MCVFYNPHPRICLLIWQRERERGENIYGREKHQSIVASCPHSAQRSNPQSRPVPWLGIKPATFWCTGHCSNQLSHWARTGFFLNTYKIWELRWTFSKPGWYSSVDWAQAENQRVASLIPSQGTCLGCGPGPQQGAHERQPHIAISLPLSPSLPLSLKINK